MACSEKVVLLHKRLYCRKVLSVKYLIFFHMKYTRLPFSETKVSIAYSGFRSIFQKERAGISFFVKKTEEGKPNLLKDWHFYKSRLQV